MKFSRALTILCVFNSLLGFVISLVAQDGNWAWPLSSFFGWLMVLGYETTKFERKN